MPTASKSNKNNSLNSPGVSRTSSGASVRAVPATAQENTSERDGRCQHLRADGKRCASANYPGHTSLCHHHLNREMRGIADGNIIAADILSAIGNFQSAAAINIAIGKIFVHQITGRISRQDALSLLYNCQLLLQTLPGVKTELHDGGYIKYWREETRRIPSGPSDLDSLTDQFLLPNGPGPLHPPDRAAIVEAAPQGAIAAEQNPAPAAASSLAQQTSATSVSASGAINETPGTSSVPRASQTESG